jgi:hypothetical protein
MDLKLPALALLALSTARPAAVSASTYEGGLPRVTPKNLSGFAWSSIRAEYQRHRQAAFPEDGGHRARNYGQRWVTRFDGRGFDVTPDSGGWRWGLELRSYGFPDQQHGVKHAHANADVEKLYYQWDSLITEWFVNGSRGLEHGFTVAARPGKSASALTLHFAVRGTLTPRISADGRWVSFLDHHGAPALNYAGLKVTDAQGRELTARFTREPEGLRLEVEEHSARYPITIDPIAQQAFLKPAAVGTTQAGDWFGYSVAVSGDTVVVGAPQEDSSSLGINSTPNEAAGASGAAYVFIRSGSVWSQQAYLKPAAVGPGGQTGDHFGWSVAVSADTVVVGAPEEDSATTGINSTPNEGATDSGAAYVFIRSGSVWSQQAYMKPAAVAATGAGAGDEFGWSVAISGDTVAVGAYDEASSSLGINSGPNLGAPGAGAAYVFARSGGGWSQQAYLKPAAVGTTQANDHFGAAIAVSGDTVVVGAFDEDSSSLGINSTPNEVAGGAGAAYVYFRSAGVWSQQAYLKPAAVGPVGQAGHFFGASVAVSGDTVVVGANHESSSTLGINTTPNDSASSSGAVYVFTRSAGVWSQQAYVKPSAVGTTQVGDDFGISVALSGDTLVVGADGEDSSTTGINTTPNESAALAGAAYVFTRSAGVWSQQAYLKPAAVGSSQAGDKFGWSVAVDGDTAVVGAYLEDSSSLGVNSSANEGAVDSGAAYVFTVPAGEDGLSGVLLYDPALGQSYTALSNGNGTYSYVPNLFSPNFNLVITGDYNGDGKADLILYNSSSALAYIGFGNGDGTFNFHSLFWSPGYTTVLTGDINGDGVTDIVLYNGSTGTMYAAISNGDGTFTYRYTLISANFTYLKLADFNGDGKADLFVYNATTGASYLGIGDGFGSFTFHAQSISPGYNLLDAGDLNGDGKADVILYNSTTGSAATGISNVSNGFNFTPLIFSPGFTSVRLGNYTGDGLASLTVYNKNTGSAYFGTGTGTGTFTFQSLFWSPGYDILVPEDVNGDGRSDIVLYNSTTGTEYTGLSNGDGTFTYTYQFWGTGKVLAQFP